MANLQEFPLVTTTGRRGRVFRASRFLDRSEFNRVVMDDGSDEKVRSADLKAQPDGTFLLTENTAERQQPVAQETRRTAPTNGSLEPVAPDAPPSEWPRDPEPAAVATMRSGTTSREPLFVEDVTVDRTPVNRLLDGPAETRQEGDVTIIPVTEEVFTVQKRLLLKEEIRITRRRRPAGDGKRIIVGDEEGTFGADGRRLDI